MSAIIAKDAPIVRSRVVKLGLAIFAIVEVVLVAGLFGVFLQFPQSADIGAPPACPKGAMRPACPILAHAG